jgi:hypothetical protein
MVAYVSKVPLIEMYFIEKIMNLLECLAYFLGRSPYVISPIDRYIHRTVWSVGDEQMLRFLSKYMEHHRLMMSGNDS